MSSFKLEPYRKKKKELVRTEQDCMAKFYSPVKNQSQVLNKWLKKPSR